MSFSNPSSPIQIDQNFHVLQEINTRLITENEFLQKQFEEATSVSNNFNEIKEKNIMLIHSLHEMQSSRDELQNRLNFALATNEDLKKQIESRPNNNDDLDVFEMHKNLLKTKSEQQKIINDLQSQLDVSKNTISQIQKQNQDLTSNISAVISASEQYFHKNFPSFDFLLQHLSTPQLESNQAEEIDNSQIQELKNKIDRYHKKYQNSKRCCKELKLQLDQSNSNMIKQQMYFNVEIEECEKKIIEIADNSKYLEANHQQKASLQEDKIKQLESEIQKAKEKINEQSNKNLNQQHDNKIDELTNEIQKKEKDLKEAKLLIHSLKNQVSSLVSQMKKMDIQNEALNSKLLESNQIKEQSMKDSENFHSEIEKYQKESNEKELKIKELQNKIDDQSMLLSQLQNDKQILKLQYDSVLKSMNLLEDEISHQKNDLSDLINQRDHLINAIQSQSNLLNKYSQIGGKIKNENNRMQKELQNEQIKNIEIIKNQEQISSDHLIQNIPSSIWLCKQFPNELKDHLISILDNDAFVGNIKVKKVLEVIGNYYNNQLFKLTSTVNSLSDLNQYHIQSFNNFMNIIFPLFQSKAYEHLYFMKSLTAEKLLETETSTDPFLKDLKNSISLDLTEQNQQKKQLENLQNIINEISKIFKLPPTNNLPKEIQDIINRLENKQVNKIAQESKLSNSQPNQLEHDFSVNEIEELSDRIDSIQSELEDLQSQNEQLTKSKEQLEKDNGILQGTLSKINEKHKKEYDELNNRNQNSIIQLSKDFSQQEAELKSKNEECMRIISQYENEISEMKSEMDEWKQRSEKYYADKSQLKKKLKSVLGEKEAEIENERKQRRLDKEKLMASFEIAKKEMRSKNQEQKEILDKVKKAYDESINLSRKALEKQKIAEISLEKLQKEQLIENERWKRDLKLMETKMKAVTLQAEAKRETEAEDLKQAFETEKIMIYATFGRNFKTFVNMKKNMDFNEFQETVVTAGAEMKRLQVQEQKLKQLIGIGNNEKLEEAIQKLLFTFYGLK